jgi:hypothetical protein
MFTWIIDGLLGLGILIFTFKSLVSTFHFALKTGESKQTMHIIYGITLLSATILGGGLFALSILISVAFFTSRSWAPEFWDEWQLMCREMEEDTEKRKKDLEDN